MKKWNHNNHYHKQLLKHIPLKTAKVLDIGSGFGDFTARLTERCTQVYSLEPDTVSLKANRLRNSGYTNITYIKDSFIEHDFGDTRFDVIVAIASIHHMDFTTALAKMKKLLSSDGQILILGLYKERTFFDYLLSVCAVVPNFIRNMRSQKDNSAMVTSRVAMSFSLIKQQSSSILGSLCINRKLYWRYLLEYKNTL